MNMQSEEINELAEALSKAQGAIEGAVKDAKNPFFKSNYADLHSVIACAKAPLSENGLAVIQTTSMLDTQLCLVTTLAHKSGQWIKSVMPVILQKQDAQSMGSAITYLRRYSYQAICGISAMDDDAESTMERKPKVEIKPTDQPSIGTLMMALAKIDTHLDKAKLAEFLAKFAVSKGTTIEAVIKSAVANQEQLSKLNKHIEEFLLGSEPQSDSD
jgi:hypothetical protein